MKMREFELRAHIRDTIDDLVVEAKKTSPKHKGKTPAKEKTSAQKTLKSLEKGAKTFKGKAKKSFGWAKNPEAALGAVYAKAGKSPKKEAVLREMRDIEAMKMSPDVHDDLPPDQQDAGFEFDGHWITNPFWDETGRFPVDPVEHYGQAFLASPLADELEDYFTGSGVDPVEEMGSYDAERAGKLPPGDEVQARPRGVAFDLDEPSIGRGRKKRRMGEGPRDREDPGMTGSEIVDYYGSWQDYEEEEHPGRADYEAEMAAQGEKFQPTTKAEKLVHDYVEQFAKVLNITRDDKGPDPFQESIWTVEIEVEGWSGDEFEEGQPTTTDWVEVEVVDGEASSSMFAEDDGYADAERRYLNSWDA